VSEKYFGRNIVFTTESMCALNIKSVKDQFMYIELNTDS